MRHYTLIVIIILSSFTASLCSEEAAVSPIFIKRHSGKSYDPSRNVTDDQLSALIEAARWAPSSHNDQPWNFIICDRTKTPEAYRKAFISFKESQQQWVQNAPLLVIVVTRTNLIYKNKPNEWAEYDTGAAAISMALQASDLGLMAHQVGGFDEHIIQQEFHLPENCIPMTIMVIGYESSEPDPKAKPRDRRSIGENFFLGEWGTGI